MIKSLLIIYFLLLSFVAKAQYTEIPDPNFEQALIDLGLDNSLNGLVITANIEDVTSLDVNSMNITDLTGIEDFQHYKS
ncbi:MAG: hypothetical protein L0J45_05415 [Psychroflexus sp.]|nr:hypothetical protein [Psychroflexus sp.]MDN6310007.1 hypothetical protein [Psychroflexus sp.]